ncbi:MAG TPA: hypothetical protein VFA39_04315 [Steroidobacteraceae bacterium]|nr:hypothetical protein [Steroidobacteraceae bacterium]
MFGKRSSILEKATAAVRTAVAAVRPTPVEPSAPVKPQPSVLLAPGRHVIDDQVVYVTGDGEQVVYSIEPGRHVIDERIVIVPRIGMFSAF